MFYVKEDVCKIVRVNLLDRDWFNELVDLSCAYNDRGDYFLEVESLLGNEDAPPWLKNLCEDLLRDGIAWVLFYSF